MKKRSFTLLEVVTSLGLFSVLAALLIGWFCFLHDVDCRIEKSQSEQKQLLTTYRRIEKLFEVTNEERFFPLPFFTTYESYSRPAGAPCLVFYFDHGIQQEPLFSGKLIGKLYHNSKDETLELHFWPLPRENYIYDNQGRKVTLLENVKQIDYLFYYPKNFSLAVNPQDVGNTIPLEGWQKEWKQSYQKLPAQVKLTVKWEQKKRDDFVMTFDLGAPIIMEDSI
jgi:hypothetical protein